MQKNKVKLHAASLVFFALFMLMLSYAAVPLYKLFCQVTGYGGTPMINELSTATGEFGDMKIRFDSSTEKNSPVLFKPQKKTINVKIGENTIIAAMTGISGSCEIGSNSMIGGQVGISGHLKIGNNVKIAAKSGVMRNIPDNTSVGGYPAVKIIDWHRSTVLNKKKK